MIVPSGVTGRFCRWSLLKSGLFPYLNALMKSLLCGTFARKLVTPSPYSAQPDTDIPVSVAQYQRGIVI
jgi:hypothetical protein